MAPASVAFDSAGNLYAADGFNNRIWKVDTNGVASTIFGGAPPQTPLFAPGSLAFDPAGNLYTLDGSKNHILKITAHTPHQPLDEPKRSQSSPERETSASPAMAAWRPSPSERTGRARF